jgi:predicted nucleic acid binding AN1-type Zn finger protein
MEFTNIGCHCQFVDCGKYDFLPFKCDLCKKSFCLDHKDYNSHICPNYQDPSTNNLLPKKKKKSKIVKYVCCHENCKKTNQVPINCLKCNKNFCMTHRYAESHNCPSLYNIRNSNTRRHHYNTPNISNITSNQLPKNIHNIKNKNCRLS